MYGGATKCGDEHAGGDGELVGDVVLQRSGERRGLTRQRRRGDTSGDPYLSDDIAKSGDDRDDAEVDRTQSRKRTTTTHPSNPTHNHTQTTHS